MPGQGRELVVPDPAEELRRPLAQVGSGGGLVAAGHVLQDPVGVEQHVPDRRGQFCSAAPFAISPDGCVQIQADLVSVRPLDTTAHAELSALRVRTFIRCLAYSLVISRPRFGGMSGQALSRIRPGIACRLRLGAAPGRLDPWERA